jgi:GT2 family glycosyltransferase
VTSCTVAICTRHRPTDLGRALTSLRWQDPAPDRILVIDDADPERRAETDAAVSASHPSASVLRKDRPGLTASRNLAIEACDTDVLTFLDDDVVLRPGYLHAVLEVFARWPDVAGVGGVVDDDHRYELPAVRALLGLPGWRSGRVYRSGWSTSLPPHDADVEHLIGCNMSFRTEILRHYPFDTGTFAGYGLGEDLELTHRMHLDGHRLRVAGDARLWHLTALPAHDRTWGHKEVAIRPIVARRRFSRPRFAVAAMTLLAHNAVTGRRDRARGNADALRAVLRGDDPGTGDMQKPIRT